MENKEEPGNKLLDALNEHGVDIDEFKRLLAFIFIMFGEEVPFVRNPHYILEKYVRYIKFPQVKNEYLWGMHPILKGRFNAYCEKFKISNDKEEVIDEMPEM